MAWAEDNSTSVSCQGGWGGGGGGGKKHGENILRKTLRGDGMRENACTPGLLKQLKFGKDKKRKKPIKIPDLMTVSTGQRAQSSFFAQKLWNIRSLPTKQCKTIAIFLYS